MKRDATVIKDAKQKAVAEQLAAADKVKQANQAVVVALHLTAVVLSRERTRLRSIAQLRTRPAI